MVQVFLLVVVSILMAGRGIAQPTNAPPVADMVSTTNVPAMRQLPLRQSPLGRGVELRTGYRLDPSSHYNDGSDVTVQRFRLGAIVRRSIRPGLMLMGDVDAEYASYAFNQRDDTIFGKSGFMQDAVMLRLGLMVMAPINAKWGWQAGGMMSVAGESHADLWEAFNSGALGGVSCIVSPDFKWSLSVMGFGFEGSFLAIPLPGFDWKISERYRLATQGPGLNFTTTLSPATKLNVLARWEYRQYRLDDDPPVPGGKYYDQRYPVGVELTRRFFRVLEVAVEGGIYAYQQMMIRDHDDNKVVTVVGDQSAYVGLRISLQL
ncbi:MAG: DUF6268 family outer membrane beta-barrel protein [Verrucomicrobiota bacterium]